MRTIKLSLFLLTASKALPVKSKPSWVQDVKNKKSIKKYRIFVYICIVIYLIE